MLNIKLVLPIFLMFIGKICFSQLSVRDSASVYFKKALLFENENKAHFAFLNYHKAKRIYEKNGVFDSLALCNLHLFDIIESQDSLAYDSKIYLDAFFNYAQEKKDTLFLKKGYSKYATYFFDLDAPTTSAKYYKKKLKLETENKQRATIYANLGLLYTEKQPDSADLFFKKSLGLFSSEHKNQLFSTHINYANFFEKQGNLKNAITQLQQAEKITPTKYEKKFKKILFEKFSNYYVALNDYKNAYVYQEKFNVLKDSLDFSSQNIAISTIKEKYDNEKLRANNLAIEAKRKQNRNLFYGALGFLLFSAILYSQNLKNSRKKRLLAEQQKELEVQKNMTLLKEQEIKAINAMVAGQEKERTRIAEDLHDNIGSVLATLKLHFENLKINREKKHFNQEELYTKTEQLIDETYHKVRSIAHAKNAGVIANQGLLVAVKIMAEKISIANKIAIEVVHFGLDKRLDNTTELNVFRIIQELTTNIIKHAEATEATINLSLFDKNLNIIIEDNGKGFDTNTIPTASGMGIQSIKKRIEHHGGTFEVDSTMNNGTSILINFPIT